MFYVVLTLGVKDLVAHGKTRQQIAEYIGADDVIFQDLDGKDGLKAACMEAAESTSQVEDFEVGVFCGKYVTEVPEGYFEHLSDIRSGLGTLVTSSGPVNGLPEGDEARIPEDREDIRYVVTDIEIALRLLTNALTVFITSQVDVRCTRNREIFKIYTCRGRPSSSGIQAQPT